MTQDKNTLEWAAQWVAGSLAGETNERVIEFGNNMAMTFRAAAIDKDPDAPAGDTQDVPPDPNTEVEWIPLLPCQACGKDGEWLDVDYENDAVICEHCGLSISPADKWNILATTTSGLAEALREMVNSAIDFDDPRISYVSMQVDRDALTAARAALARWEGKQ